MTTITKNLNVIDKYVEALEKKEEVQKQLIEKYKNINESLEADQDKLLERIEELDGTVTHWQDLWQREHDAFTQAAEERDQAIRNTSDERRRGNSFKHQLKEMTAFIDNICEMVACDCDLRDLAEECILWRRGEWMLTDEEPEYADDAIYKGTDGVVEAMKAEDQRPSDPYKYKVLVVEEKGDEAIFTGFYANYDLARESVDLMVARGCYEAWVEELQ